MLVPDGLLLGLLSISQNFTTEKLHFTKTLDYMSYIFDNKYVLRSRDEWKKFLDNLLQELSDHLGLELNKCSYFVEEQSEGDTCYGCHIDFRATLSEELNLELCGILCFTVNWGERAHAGAFLLYYQEGERLCPKADDEYVAYMPRELSGWGRASLELGEAGEWSSYTTMKRWE